MTPAPASSQPMSAMTPGNIVAETRIIPYPPIFRRTPARITLAAVGASVCASGSQVCSGQTGSFIAKPMKSSVNTKPMGRIRLPAAISAGSLVMSNVPVEKNSVRIPISMNALPRRVNIRNFIAEYSLRPLPHTAMRKNIGTSSSSHSKKNRRKSRAVKTPITAVCKTSSQRKYSRTRVLIPHEAYTATIPSNPVSRTSGALRPSTPRKYCALKEVMGIQLSTLSTSCTPPSARRVK